MPIAVVCTCGARLQAPDAAAGKRVKCPKCQNPLAVPAPAMDYEVVEDEPAPAPVAVAKARPKPQLVEDDEEAPRPAKKKPRVVDEEDEKPRKKSKSVEVDEAVEDDEEDEKPKKKSRRARDDEDEDEKPAKKSQRSRDDDKEDEDDAPKKKGKGKKSALPLLLGLLGGLVALGGGAFAVYWFVIRPPDTAASSSTPTTYPPKNSRPVPEQAGPPTTPQNQPGGAGNWIAYEPADAGFKVRFPPGGNENKPSTTGMSRPKDVPAEVWSDCKAHIYYNPTRELSLSVDVVRFTSTSTPQSRADALAKYADVSNPSGAGPVQLTAVKWLGHDCTDRVRNDEAKGQYFIRRYFVTGEVGYVLTVQAPKAAYQECWQPFLDTFALTTPPPSGGPPHGGGPIQLKPLDFTLDDLKTAIKDTPSDASTKMTLVYNVKDPDNFLASNTFNITNSFFIISLHNAAAAGMVEEAMKGLPKAFSDAERAAFVKLIQGVGADLTKETDKTTAGRYNMTAKQSLKYHTILVTISLVENDKLLQGGK